MGRGARGVGHRGQKPCTEPAATHASYEPPDGPQRRATHGDRACARRCGRRPGGYRSAATSAHPPGRRGQRVLDRAQQGGARERLLDEGEVAGPRAVADEHVLGVPRHVDDAQVGVALDGHLGELLAGHARHDDVGDEHVDLLPRGERLLAAGRLGHLIAVRREDPAGLAADRLLVLDDEHPAAPGACSPGSAGGSGERTCLAAAGQEDGDAGAPPGRGLDVDRAARVGDDAVHGRQPQARALAGVLGGEEGLEGAVAHLLGMPGPVVDHGDAHAVGHAGHGDGQRAAVGHRVARVDGEVDQHLLELRAIGEHGQQAGADGDAQRDALAQRAVEQALEVAQQAADVEHLGLDHLAAAEHEQLARERRGAIGRAPDLLDVVADRVVGGQLARGEADAGRGSPTAGC